MEQIKAYSYIRFSSKRQADGDSLRRQTEATERYVKEHGLTLDDSLKYRDLGISAFHGKNRYEGALGEFLRLIREGDIPRGSVLIIENLDRLSRDEVLEAFNQFSSIIQAGITVVTLQDGMEYSKESIGQNWSQLIISITYMARAYDESERKSQRIRAAWTNKREIAATEGGKKLTHKAPIWLTLDRERTAFQRIPEACRAIEIIYHMKLAGRGASSIERELNTRTDIWSPPASRKQMTTGWRASYIEKILKTRSIIGEFTPTKLVEGKRVPQEPIPNYFPAAIDEELFYAVQEAMRHNGARAGRSGGKTGKAKNLFAHIVRCGLCNGPMHYVDKGKPPKGGIYLQCYNSARKAGCTAKAIRYDEFEGFVFEDFNELNIADLLPDKDELLIYKNDIENKVAAGNQRLVELEAQILNLTDAISTTGDKRLRDLITIRLSAVLYQKEGLIQVNKELNDEHRKLIDGIAQMQANVDIAKDIHELLNACKDEDEGIKLRLRLRIQIRKLIEYIAIYPLQEAFVPEQEIEPGVYVSMESKYIDSIRIRFNGGKKFRSIRLKRRGVVDY